MRRLVGLCLAVAVIACLLSACGSDTDPDPADATTAATSATTTPSLTATVPDETTTAMTDPTGTPASDSTDAPTDSTAAVTDPTAPSSAATVTPTTAATTARPIPSLTPGANNTQLFTAAQSGIYHYCPSIMQTDDTTRYVYYCTNTRSGDVTDHIGCRKGTRRPDGSWAWGDEHIVLSPTADSWDARHTCDPSVIAGRFAQNGHTYRYLMAYLGCTTSDNQCNMTGIAVADDPLGPFVKVDTLNPLVPYTPPAQSNGVFLWGNGQPSLISVDQQGTVLLFYTLGTVGGTNTYVEKWDLSDLSHPTRAYKNKLSSSGLTDLLGNADYVNNADFVYDPWQDTVYAAADCHPCPADAPDYIADTFRLLRADALSASPLTAASPHWTSCRWTTVAQIGPAQTGAARNHNVGIVTDAYGWALTPLFVPVVYTRADAGNNSLFSYRLCDYFVPLD